VLLFLLQRLFTALQVCEDSFRHCFVD
jgi:hypothetical protein